jgi:long-chain acyl-CoA synthetase
MEDKPWLKHYDPQVPASLAPYPDKPVFSFLDEAAARFPDRPCTIFRGCVLTYRKMKELSGRMAAALADLGIGKGDRVGIAMPNIPQFVIAYYGILKAGGVVVCTNPLYTPRELEHQLRDSGVELLLVMSGFYRRMKAAQSSSDLKTLVVTNLKEYLPGRLRLLFTLVKESKGGHRVQLAPGDLWMKDLLAMPAEPPKVSVTGRDPALLQYTGGTTGLSKGAVLSHGNLVANTLQMRAWFHSMREGQERCLAAIPMFHVYGMMGAMLLSTISAASIVMVPDPRDLKDVLENIRQYRPTAFPGVPTLYNAINNHPDVRSGKYDLASIRACFSGAAPLLLATRQQFEKLSGGKLIEAYGLSEASPATHCNPLMGVNKEGSIGLPLPDVECRIISGRPCRPAKSANWSCAGRKSSKAIGTCRRKQQPRFARTQTVAAPGSIPATSPAWTRTATSTSWIARRT